MSLTINFYLSCPHHEKTTKSFLRLSHNSKFGGRKSGLHFSFLNFVCSLVRAGIVCTAGVSVKSFLKLNKIYFIQPQEEQTVMIGNTLQNIKKAEN